MSKQVHQEKIIEWLDNPVTLLYLEILNERIASLQKSERYRPTMSIGDSHIPVSAEFVAMQQAHLQGQIENLQEISNLEEMFKDDES